MNIRRTRRTLEKFYGGLNIGVKFEETSEKIRAVSENVSIKGYDDDVFIAVNFYDIGIASFDFVFDKLDINSTTLGLINDFNTHVFAFKAYIGENNYLHISHEAEPISDDIVYDYVNNVFNDILSDRIRKYLEPLSKLSR